MQEVLVYVKQELCEVIDKVKMSGKAPLYDDLKQSERVVKIFPNLNALTQLECLMKTENTLQSFLLNVFNVHTKVQDYSRNLLGVVLFRGILDSELHKFFVETLGITGYDKKNIDNTIVLLNNFCTKFQLPGQIKKQQAVIISEQPIVSNTVMTPQLLRLVFKYLSEHDKKNVVAVSRLWHSVVNGTYFSKYSLLSFLKDFNAVNNQFETLLYKLSEELRGVIYQLNDKDKISRGLADYFPADKLENPDREAIAKKLFSAAENIFAYEVTLRQVNTAISKLEYGDYACALEELLEISKIAAGAYEEAIGADQLMCIMVSALLSIAHTKFAAFCKLSAFTDCLMDIVNSVDNKNILNGLGLYNGSGERQYQYSSIVFAVGAAKNFLQIQDQKYKLTNEAKCHSLLLSLALRDILSEQNDFRQKFVFLQKVLITIFTKPNIKKEVLTKLIIKELNNFIDSADTDKLRTAADSFVVCLNSLKKLSSGSKICDQAYERYRLRTSQRVVLCITEQQQEAEMLAKQRLEQLLMHVGNMLDLNDPAVKRTIISHFFNKDMKHLEIIRELYSQALQYANSQDLIPEHAISCCQSLIERINLTRTQLLKHDPKSVLASKLMEVSALALSAIGQMAVLQKIDMQCKAVM